MAVMIAGRTKGVTWELQEMLKQDKMGRLLLLLPPIRDSEFNLLLSHLAEIFRDSSWHAAMASLPANVLAVQFEEAGRIVIIQSARKREREFSLAILFGLHAMLSKHISRAPQMRA